MKPHTDNKQDIRKLIQSPSKWRSYVTPGDLYHRANLERANKILLCLFILMWLHRNGVITSSVLYSTILYCTVLYIGNHSRNDYFGFIIANFLEINNNKIL